MQFFFYRLRFHFQAEAAVHFAPGKSGNILRGAFGSVFRRIACVPQCRDAKTCEIRADCPYARIFEPVAVGGGPSGLADHPRPFVFRASHLDGCTVPAGSAFYFDVHLFDSRHTSIAYFILTFAQLGREGLGPGRSRASLTGVEQLDPSGARMQQIFDGGSISDPGVLIPSSLICHPTSRPHVTRVPSSSE